MKCPDCGYMVDTPMHELGCLGKFPSCEPSSYNDNVDYEREREENRLNGTFNELTIRTRVPSKWRFVDLETGEVWKWGTYTGDGIGAKPGFEKAKDGQWVPNS